MRKTHIEPIKRTLGRLLGHHQWPLIAACIAVALTMGSANTGLQFDDYFHQMKIRPALVKHEPSAALLHLFEFSDGDADKTRTIMEFGALPWWTYEGFQVRFFRPLAAAGHLLDYWLWPEKPLWMHLHSLLWFGAMVLCAGLIYRRLLTPAWLAGLATLLFAIDDAHGIPAGWLANRNALMAAVFGFVAIYSHLRLRQAQWRPGFILGPVSFALGLLCAEIGLSALAYLAAFEGCLGTGTRRRRALNLWPYLVIAALWYGAYQWMGYGAYGSGFYVDPGHSPGGFLWILFKHLPLLLIGQWSPVDPAGISFLPGSSPHVALAVGGLVLTGSLWVLWPLVRRDATARFWALGMLLALVPIGATMPMKRLLLFVGLGAMGLLAQFLAAWGQKPHPKPAENADRRPAFPIRRGLTAVMAVLLIVVHGVVAPLILPIRSKSMATLAESTLEGTLLALQPTQQWLGKRFFFINAPMSISIGYLPMICLNHRWPMPKLSRVLSAGSVGGTQVRRIDARTLEVEPEAGFMATEHEMVVRGPSQPLAVGQVVKLKGLTAEVRTLTEDLRPLCVRFTFEAPLEDPSQWFFAWHQGGFKRFKPPAIGASAYLERALPDLDPNPGPHAVTDAAANSKFE